MKSISTPHSNNVSLAIGTKLNDHYALVNVYFILPQELDEYTAISCVLDQLFSSFYYEEDIMQFEPHDFDVIVEISKHLKGYLVRSCIKSTKSDLPEPIVNTVHARIDTMTSFYLLTADE